MVVGLGAHCCLPLAYSTPTNPLTIYMAYGIFLIYISSITTIRCREDKIFFVLFCFLLYRFIVIISFIFRKYLLAKRVFCVSFR